MQKFVPIAKPSWMNLQRFPTASEPPEGEHSPHYIVHQHCGPETSLGTRPKAPTIYWQAIVARNLIVLQQERDIALVCVSVVASPAARRDNTLASKTRYPPFKPARTLPESRLLLV